MLKTQALGVFSVAAWVAGTMTVAFFFLKKTVGLRVTREEEIAGLDFYEHGLSSSYADFMPVMEHFYEEEDTGVTVIDMAAPEPAVDPDVSAVSCRAQSGPKMTKKMNTVRRANFTRADRTAMGHEIEVRYIAAITV